MRRCWRFLVLAVFLCASPAVVASQQDCSEPFFGGQAPVLLNAKLREKTRELCFSQFTALHSGITRGPLWSAEDLLRANLTIAVSLPRPSSNTFHVEDSLPANERSTLDDYRRSGFDRGHMTPNSDMSTPQAQEESFTLANIVPQHPCNNEVLWEGVESAVRAVALGEGEVFVVTGAAFIGAELDSLQGRVMVPTHIFKAVYIPSRDEAGAYWAPNDDSQNWEAISVSRLRDLSGIDPFPSLAESVKAVRGDLPAPTPHHGCRLGGKGNPKKTQSLLDWYRRYRNSPWFRFILSELGMRAP
jgi:endonuclease G